MTTESKETIGLPDGEGEIDENLFGPDFGVYSRDSTLNDLDMAKFAAVYIAVCTRNGQASTTLDLAPMHITPEALDMVLRQLEMHSYKILVETDVRGIREPVELKWEPYLGKWNNVQGVQTGRIKLVRMGVC